MSTAGMQRRDRERKRERAASGAVVLIDIPAENIQMSVSSVISLGSQ